MRSSSKVWHAEPKEPYLSKEGLSKRRLPKRPLQRACQGALKYLGTDRGSSASKSSGACRTPGPQRPSDPATQRPSALPVASRSAAIGG
eukprot:scaffold805_cov251-Pinguiococcus_pyrenoidosus.AAC.7